MGFINLSNKKLEFPIIKAIVLTKAAQDKWL
jgi:hypothetical protein